MLQLPALFVCSTQLRGTRFGKPETANSFLGRWHSTIFGPSGPAIDGIHLLLAEVEAEAGIFLSLLLLGLRISEPQFRFPLLGGKLLAALSWILAPETAQTSRTAKPSLAAGVSSRGVSVLQRCHIRFFSFFVFFAGMMCTLFYVVRAICIWLRRDLILSMSMRPLLEAFSRLICWMLEKDLLLNQRCGVWAILNDRQWIPAGARMHKAYSFATVQSASSSFCLQ